MKNMKNKVLAIIAILMFVTGPRIVDAAADTGEKPSDDGFITISERTYYDEELDAEIKETIEFKAYETSTFTVNGVTYTVEP